MRSGTDNGPGIVGFAKAAEMLFANMDEEREKLCSLRDSFIEQIKDAEGISVNGPAKEEVTREFAAPHIISVSVQGVRAEVLLHALEEKGVYVSSGSACASNKPAISETLKAIGLKKELLDSTIRFSLSVLTTEEEISYAARTLKDVLGVLRQYVRR